MKQIETRPTLLAFLISVKIENLVNDFRDLTSKILNYESFFFGGWVVNQTKIQAFKSISNINFNFTR